MGTYYATRWAGEELLPLLRRALSEASGPVRDLAVVEDTCYAAIERIEDGVTEALIVTRWRDDPPTTRYLPEKHVTNFRYDVSGEHSFPHFIWEKHTRCPRRILELLGPIREVGAQAWRRRCYARIGNESTLRLASELQGGHCEHLREDARDLAWSDAMLSPELGHLWKAIAYLARADPKALSSLIGCMLLTAARAVLPDLSPNPSLLDQAVGDYLDEALRCLNEGHVPG